VVVNDFYLFFFIAISFSGILCALVLLILNRVEKHANRLLAFGLLNISIVLLLNGLTYVDWFYLTFPHTYRLGIFTQYLLAPFFYLYVRATIRREVSFYKWDWLHFVPAVLHFIEFIPFYLMPTDEKVRYLKYAFSHLELLSKQQEGLLPANFHPFLKTATGIVYQFFQARLLFLVYKNNRNWLKKNMIFWKWLVRLTFFHCLTYVFVFVSYCVYFSRIDMRAYSILALALVQFFCTINLLFNPMVLYGMKENIDQEKLFEFEENNKISGSKKNISFVKKMIFKKRLEDYIEIEKPFLKKKYSIRDLAADCDIPVHYLSVVINEEFGCNYNDFINGFRVKFIIKHRYVEEWYPFSLEGLASEAGFNSRNSFFIAFKKATGQTPSGYFSQKNNGPRVKPGDE